MKGKSNLPNASVKDDIEMRKIAEQILLSPEVSDLLARGNRKKQWVCTRVMEFADAYLDLVGDESDFVKDATLAMLPETVKLRFASSHSGHAIVSGLITKAKELEAAFDLSLEAYAEAKERKLEIEKRLVAEELKRQEEEKLAAEIAKEEEAKAKAAEIEAIKQAERERAQRLIAEQEEQARKAREEAEKHAAEILKTEDVPQAAPANSERDFATIRLDDSGLPSGLVQTLADAGVNTVDDLVLWGEASGYDSIPGVGPKAVEKIKAKLDELKG